MNLPIRRRKSRIKKPTARTRTRTKTPLILMLSQKKLKIIPSTNLLQIVVVKIVIQKVVSYRVDIVVVVQTDHSVTIHDRTKKMAMRKSATIHTRKTNVVRIRDLSQDPNHTHNLGLDLGLGLGRDLQGVLALKNTRVNQAILRLWCKSPTLRVPTINLALHVMQIHHVSKVRSDHVLQPIP